jgi:hypothetical protein
MACPYTLASVTKSGSWRLPGGDGLKGSDSISLATKQTRLNGSRLPASKRIQLLKAGDERSVDSCQVLSYQQNHSKVAVKKR